jgi:hypothetical protein
MVITNSLRQTENNSPNCVLLPLTLLSLCLVNIILDLSGSLFQWSLGYCPFLYTAIFQLLDLFRLLAASVFTNSCGTIMDDPVK